jgi:hypothetical protein
MFGDEKACRFDSGRIDDETLPTVCAEATRERCLDLHPPRSCWAYKIPGFPCVGRCSGKEHRIEEIRKMKFRD